MKPILRIIRDISGSPSMSLPQDIVLPALEESWTLSYRQTSSSGVQARCNGNGMINISGRTRDPDLVLTALNRWLYRQARASLVPWLDELSEQSGLPYGKVSIRSQRTRWASCSSKGNINLNCKLLFLSPDVVRYILNHELCHTIHPNHSADFWRAVCSLEPGYRHLNALAKKGMELVPEWAKGE